MLKPESKAWVLPVFLLSSLCILFVDYLTPRGSADYIFYFVPVALAVYHGNPMFPVWGAAFCTLLSVIGFITSPDSGIAIEVTRANRFFAMVAMWVVSYQVKDMIKNRNNQQRTNWLRAGTNLLSEKTRGELSVREVADNILQFLNERIEAKVSAIYLKDKNDTLTYSTGHAFTPDPTKAKVTIGEGLLGQCAESRTLMTVPTGTDHIKLSSSLGESLVNNLTFVPLTADDQVVAVIEIAQFRSIHEHEQEFLQNIAEPAGIALKSAQNKEKVNELLHQTQQFAEELQAQQEELRVSNEELEQQTKALKESQVRLENQAAEMEQTNQQLEEQAQALETQKTELDEKNAQLEERALDLKKASQYKSEFLANMSHELRTPLNSTLILAKLLSDNKPGNLNEEQVKYAEIIHHSGTDLLNLINDILDLSKVEAGKMTVAPEVVNVEKISEMLKNLFTPQALQKSLDFKVEVDPKLAPEIITDRFRLEQILKNFLSNAFKFTHKGSVILQVFPDNNGVTFAVSDTGVGMSADEQQVIFEAFRQADGTTSRKYGGTGLGLSISRELGHLLGGEIKVQSQKGQGSTFSLNLPLEFKAPDIDNIIVVEPVKNYTPKKVATTPSKETQADMPKFSFEDDRHKIRQFQRTMLIIEDDEQFAQILYELAHEMNFGAIVTPTGEEGMNLAKEYQPHAIVLDVRLPDHSGMIVLDHLKMNTKTRHIPVHVISSEDFSRSALEMGAIGYMLKPVKRDELSVAFQNMNALLEQKVKHVLVVEDDQVQRDHITNLVADPTIQVTSTETAREALELLSKNTYDLMVMDLSLPDMTGHELLKNLSQENSNYSFPPVIVYTARDLTTEEEEKLRLYAGSIIIKGAKSPERLLSEVTLFLHRVETDLPLERQKMLRDLRSRDKSLDGKTILVVDDDVRNIFALSSALENYGARIETARNGKEAISKLDARPDTALVLMDIMMPEMDGYTAMREIRKKEIFKDLPVIALTAKAMRDDKDKCLEAGANDYLSKPLEMDKLLSLIRVWLPQKRRFTN